MGSLEAPDEFRLTLRDRVRILLTIPLLNFVLRIADVVVLLARPRLLRAYAAVVWAHVRRSPFEWPRGFETVRALKQSGQSVAELVYGETPVVTGVVLFRAAGVEARSHVLDLGAGRGRALIAARWLGARATGVELLRDHVAAVEAPLSRVGVTLLENDAASIPLEGATHVFMNWLGFGSAMRERLLPRLRESAPGTRFITTGQPIETPGIEILRSGWLPFTWGFAQYFVQRWGLEQSAAADRH